jgi:hypothetical protein
MRRVVGRDGREAVEHPMAGVVGGAGQRRGAAGAQLDGAAQALTELGLK